MKLEQKIILYLISFICLLLLINVVAASIRDVKNKELKWICRYGSHCYDKETAERRCKYIKELYSEEQCSLHEEILND